MMNTPDFTLMLADGTMECHEIKGGYLMDDGLVKWKVAGEKFPFVFRMVFALPKKDGGGWRVRTYGE